MVEIDAKAGPRKRNRFIVEALTEKVKELKREEMLRLLEEGYRTTREEDRPLTEDFAHADLEVWDDY
jgi:hypothetical protein